MKLNKITAAVLAGLMTASFAAPVMADTALTGADAIAKRQELMKLNGMTLRAAGSATGDDAVAAAQTFVDNFTMLETLWPEDSQGGESDALPAVWEDHDAFMMAMSNASAAAGTVLSAAQSGDMAAYGAALKGLGATCGGCHKTFKQP